MLFVAALSAPVISLGCFLLIGSFCLVVAYRSVYFLRYLLFGVSSSHHFLMTDSIRIHHEFYQPDRLESYRMLTLPFQP